MDDDDWGAEFLGGGGGGGGNSTGNGGAAAAAPSSAPTPSRPPWALRVLRSVQLDAGRLDAELVAMLREQLLRALAQGGLFPAGRVAALEPELSALLAALVWGGTVARGGATPGSALMNLRYRDERPFSSGRGGSPLASLARESSEAADAATRAAGRPLPPSWVFGDGAGVEGRGLSARQRALFGAGLVLLPYVWARASRAAYDARAGGGGGGGTGGSRFVTFGQLQQQQEDEDGEQGGATTTTRAAAAAFWRRAAPRVEAAWRAAALLNLLAFLRRGVYRTLLERALSARLVPERPCAPRSVSFEYLNRQLVWQELSEFVLFVLPLLDNARRLRAGVRRWLPRPAVSAAAAEGSGGALLGGGVGGETGGALGGYCVAAALPGEEEMDREEREAEERRRRGWGWGVRRRAGEGGGGAKQEQADSAADGNGAAATGGWIAQQLGAAASVMAGAVAAGAARVMMEGGGGDEEGEEGEAAAAAPVGDSNGNADGDDGDDPARPPGPCPLCGAGEILTPYVALPCRHVFCYYCLRANTEGDARFACPVDGRRVRFLRRWAPRAACCLGAVGAGPPPGGGDSDAREEEG